MAGGRVFLPLDIAEVKFSEIQLSTGGIKETTFQEWMLRFIFGGAVSLMAGLVAQKCGPEVGGLFLGFPSILPATVTLVKQHEGRQQAADDARGAALGSIGLIVFGVVVLETADRWGPVGSLTAAAIGWILARAVAWQIAA